MLPYAFRKPQELIGLMDFRCLPGKEQDAIKYVKSSAVAFGLKRSHPMRVACHHAAFVSPVEGTTAIGFVHGHAQKRFGSKTEDRKDKSMPQGS
jgi:hypothetical protein